MNRIPEPELMDDETQARAYAEADFESAHSAFIALFRETFPQQDPCGYVLDLGCGPGDISKRFARAYPKCTVHGVDGSEAMLRYGRKMLAQEAALQSRVELFHGLLPGATLPRTQYNAVVSNSLLHHLHDPSVLWQSVTQFAEAGACVFIMDLRRPKNEQDARRLVEMYATNEPAVLKRDFYNSFLAAFEPFEIEVQLKHAGLDYFSVKVATDRHVTVSGVMGL
jgi:SAM-dependent methyltransferase